MADWAVIRSDDEGNWNVNWVVSETLAIAKAKELVEEDRNLTVWLAAERYVVSSETEIKVEKA